MYYRKIAILLLLLYNTSTHLQAQSFFLYGSGTLAEATINPYSRVFDPKTDHKKLAFSFLLGQLQLDIASYGPASHLFYVKDFLNKINSGSIQANTSGTNYISSQEQIHLFSLKIHSRKKASDEILVDYSIRGVGFADFKNSVFDLVPKINDFFRGNFTSLTSSLLGKDYRGIFNTHSFYYGFTQIVTGYRANIDNDLSFGFQLGYLSGIAGGTFQISQSNVIADSRGINLISNGLFQVNKSPSGDSSFQSLTPLRSYLPNFKNPGFIFNLGFNYQINASSEISANVKDLGFIHWNGSQTYKTYPSILYSQTDTFNFPQIAKKNFKSLYYQDIKTSYNALLPLRLEGIYQRNFLPNFKSILVVSKNILTPEGNIHLNNDVQFKNIHCIVSGGYSLLDNFQLGFHVLFKNPTFEAFLGSENFLPSTRFFHQLGGTDEPQGSPAFNFSLGCAFKIWNFFNVHTTSDMRLKGPYNFLERLFQPKPI